jgi:hypothetical protein
MIREQFMMDVLKAADKYLLCELTAHCLEAINLDMDKGNVCFYLASAIRNRSIELQHVCHVFIGNLASEDKEELTETKDFLELSDSDQLAAYRCFFPPKRTTASKKRTLDSDESSQATKRVKLSRFYDAVEQSDDTA